MKNLLFACCLMVFNSAFAGPKGIYALGAIGQPVDESLLSKPFIDGWTMRAQWKDLEPTKSLYNFKPIADAVAAAHRAGKKLTVEIFNLEPPAYILTTPGVETYTALVQGVDKVVPVPWDSVTQSRWLAFCQSLGAQFGADPTIAQIDSPIPGLQGIRDIGRRLVNSPGYSRDKLIRAITQSIHAMADNFPVGSKFVAFFPIADNNRQPGLDRAIDEALNAEFGLNILSYFEENLSCEKPQATWAWMLAETARPTLFQMLQSWIQPFANPDSTDSCLITATPNDRTTAISGPDVGMAHGLDDFNAKYFEVYVTDLKHPGFEDEFTTWHDRVWR